MAKKTKNKSDLETEITQLTTALQSTQAEKQKLLENLGKMRYRVIEVLDLDLDTRNNVIYEIDKVFSNSL